MLQSPSLAIVVAFALRISLLWWIHRDRDAHQYLFFPTSHEAWNVAWSMASGNGFASPLAGMHGPTAWVAPGYPPVIALGLRLFHMDVYAATILALAINCTVAALTCWPIYAIGKKIGDHNIGLASCWLWAFLPTAILFPLEWLWDPSFSAFFLALLVYLTLELSTMSSTLPWVGYGLLWSVAVLMNPAIGILFPFLLLWVAQHRRRNSLPWWPQVSRAVLVLILCLLPWTARNYLAFGKLIPIKNNFGLELWLGNNSTVKKNWSPDRHPVGDHEQMMSLIDFGEANYMEAKQREAIEFIEAHPAVFIKLSLGRLVDTWTGLGDVPSDRWVNALHAGRAYIGFSAAFSLAAFAGLFLMWRFRDTEFVPLSMTLIIFPATYYITHTSLRYRHPIDPVMTVLAIYALARAYSFACALWPESDTLRSNRTP
jgi:hypothetical protein